MKKEMISDKKYIEFSHLDGMTISDFLREYVNPIVDEHHLSHTDIRFIVDYNYSDTDLYLGFQREETNEEFKQRKEFNRKNALKLEKAKQKRYNEYLKLKKEFE